MIWQHPHVLTPKDATDSNSHSPSEVLHLLKKYPPRLPSYAYGTAGFRYDASAMDAVMIRVAVFCVWWYPQLQSGVELMANSLGIMVTASHNDESYNGVKLVQPNGEILADRLVQEQLTDWVNSDSSDSHQVHRIQKWLEEMAKNESGDFSSNSPSCVIHVGHDTRSHSPALTELAIKTIRSLGGQVQNHGVATTPLLHHVVFHFNPQHVPSLIPIRPDAIGYFHILAWSYYNLLRTSTKLPACKRLVLDCACGVGYPSAVVIQQVLQSISSKSSFTTPSTRLLLVNGPNHGPLNEHCGSEFVQKANQPPRWYQSSDDVHPISPDESWEYSCSFDGDADRIVFFSKSGSNNNFFLLDGDKIAVLICEFLQAQVAALEQSCQGQSSSLGKLRLGAVQTAYANGASTKYLKKVLGAENVLIAKTGVQHVHHAAKSFDIGVYFEANGHGTVVFGPNFYSYLAQAEAVFMTLETGRSLALQRLRLLPSLINQAVGDALSDLLLVDAILHIQEWDLEKWNQLYSDMPSRMTKLKVKDRAVLKTNENDTICLEPAKVQQELDAAMKDFNGRCFVRASGTEDVVRVYAEADTRETADQLSVKAEQIVYKLCGGVGDPPVFPPSRI